MCRFYWAIWADNAVVGRDGARGTRNATNSTPNSAAYRWCHHFKVGHFCPVSLFFRYEVASLAEVAP